MRKLTLTLATLLLAFGLTASAGAHSATHYHNGGTHSIVADTSTTGHSSYLTSCAFFSGFGWVRTEWHKHYTRARVGALWYFSHEVVAGYKSGCYT